MNIWALWIVTALYAWQSCVFLFSGGIAMSVVFFGYFIANIGLMIAVRGL